MRDLIAELNLTRRAVAAADLHGSPAHVVELSRELHASIDDAWGACTDPERVRRWFLPLTGDLRPGGTFQIEGNAGGSIIACDPPHRLQVTWAFGEAQPSLVTLALTSKGADATELVLSHTVPDDDQWAKFGPGAVGVGWDLSLAALAQYAAGDTPDPSNFGPAVMRASAGSWGAADEAGGAPAEIASAAAENTSNFYAPATG
jgi:uncharacterized protein YndB with AHSA1/START domain